MHQSFHSPILNHQLFLDSGEECVLEQYVGVSVPVTQTLAGCHWVCFSDCVMVISNFIRACFCTNNVLSQLRSRKGSVTGSAPKLGEMSKSPPWPYGGQDGDVTMVNEGCHIFRE